ncbi:LOW QUALITY PROTEIN: tubulin polyglutamylase TTLL5 [Rhinatrema bivittatum]|uniref:LOW QUALITY PROTEIN: tubulin polyglutamylase TTLL5 n=1 Tax=Rhinatrema bivittatum TaxID=194408 RepID=UPI001128C168|nr:LOW QUALITY PROTEIN: tubulin polyglutamylase TTLL5 [Rhinatrema bivittatum]
MPLMMTRELHEIVLSSDEEEEEEEEEEVEEEHVEDHPCILWTGGARKVPIMVFHAEAILTKDSCLRIIGERYRLSYKIVRTDSRLIRSILSAHGFHEVHPNSSEFHLMWTGSHLKPYLMRSLLDFQKGEPLPRSYELTRKDRLYKNVHRMQQTHGFKNFHLLPQTFILPMEYQELNTAHVKDRGPWIVKPVASSRGRGVYVVNTPSQISLEENILVSRYINNPLLIDGFKFDVRLYVLVTSYDPLVIYLYEEGLSRFATVKYDKAAKNIKNQFMHLTNYSVNKKSSDYVSCDDPEVEDYGNKWSMSAMLRYLKQEGKDTTALMAHIEDLIIKTIISGELAIATACKAFMAHRSSCFELYGFDVLIDAHLKPWLLEVNLSPSLACDAPLDLKVKASMISDMFTIVGFVCQDSSTRRSSQSSIKFIHASRPQRPVSAQSRTSSSKSRQLPQSASDADINVITTNKEKMGKRNSPILGLSMEEIKFYVGVKEESERTGGFIRIFPRQDTWELYGPFLEHRTTMNYMLATRLFHERTDRGITSYRSRSLVNGPEMGSISLSTQARVHAMLYERKLLSLEVRKRRRRLGRLKLALVRRTDSSRAAAAQLGSGSEREEEEEEPEEVVENEEEEAHCTTALGLARVRAAKDMRCHQDDVFLNQRAGSELNDKCDTKAVKLKKPQLNILKFLQEDGNLSKIQARLAFSAYLQRVQMRLKAECNVHKESNAAWAATEDEQMELVMRFLKRAAGNLQQSLRMVLPSRRLPLLDRRRILAYQLSEFLHSYNWETDQMIQKKSKEDEEELQVNADDFQAFILHASESDLEEVLTAYTHKNKSASVFLGTNPKSAKSCRSGESSSPVIEGSLEKTTVSGRKERESLAIENPEKKGSRPSSALQHKPLTAFEEERIAQPGNLGTSVSGSVVPKPCVSQPSIPDAGQVTGQHSPLICAPLSSPSTFTQVSSSTASASSSQMCAPSGSWAYPTMIRNPEGLPCSRPASHMTSPSSSFQSAAQIYSQKLARPSSAKAGCCQQSPSRQRVGSAGGLKDREDVSLNSAAHTQSPISTALQRLTEKQANKQHCTSGHMGLLTQQLKNASLVNSALHRASKGYNAGLRQTMSSLGPVRARQESAQPSAAVRSLECDSMGWDAEVENTIYNMMAGVPPEQKHQPTISSYQLQYALQQLQLQRLQSQQLLDQSRVRHQAALTNHLVPSSTQWSVPTAANVQWTPNMFSSGQKATNQPKGALSQSSSHRIPKPPPSHKLGIVRKKSSQYSSSRVASTEGPRNRIQNRMSATPTCQTPTGSSDALAASQVIFARSKPVAHGSKTTGKVVVQKKGKAVQPGPD